ncbi:MAG: SGNH/GDSL hydrolase family protein [Candidatus Omnitrophica bacterium]|nr:SGNH/GDSL hydrolase family protein [Candidatus Omnitrophota bacterium]
MKEAGGLPYFFLGGSTTACTYLPQEDLSPLIEDHLNPAGASATYECANAGVDGCAARDSLAQLIYNVSWAQPDCVIVMQGVNDFALGLTPDYEEDASDRRTARSKAKKPYEEFEEIPTRTSTSFTSISPASIPNASHLRISTMNGRNWRIWSARRFLSSRTSCHLRNI